MTETHFDSPFGGVTLRRWPVLAEQRLQAWDGADRWLLAHLSGDEPPAAALVLLNDAWGALASCLAAHCRVLVSCADDFAARQAMELNAAANELPPIAWRWPGELAPLGVDQPSQVMVIARLPQDIALLGEQLAQLRQALPAGTPVLLAGLDKHLPRRLKEHLAQWLDDIQTLPGRFKAHGFSGRLLEKPTAPGPAVQPWPEQGGDLRVFPGVHARQHLDVGGRLLASHVPQGLTGQIADLGCGSGMLGITALLQNPEASVYFCDSSAQAIACARENVRRLCPGVGDRAVFHHGNGLDGLQQAFDCVLLNPPFHSGTAVDTTVADMLIRHAGRQLAPGGLLRLVCNRHLDYRKALKTHLGGLRQLAQTSKFRVVEAYNKTPA